MAASKDYNRQHTVSYGPSCRVTVNGQDMGLGGFDVYRLYGATKNDDKFNIGINDAGLLKIESDIAIQISAGEKNGKKGEDIIINSRNGNIDIVASANGCIKIRCGGSIAFESTDVSFVCNEFKVNGNKIVLDGNTVQSRAIDGNLAPPGETFIEKAFDGTFVGEDVIQNTLKQDC